MITERARIVALDDDAVWVEARRESACGRCAARAGCGHGLLEQAASRRLVHLKLPRPDRAEVADDLAEGQTVLVGIDEHAVLVGAVRVYAIPLAGFLAGALAGSMLGGDGPAMLGAALGFAAALVAVRALDRRHPPVPPRILRRVESLVRPAAADDDEPRPVTLV